MEKKTVSARVWENGAASRSDCGCKQYVWDIGLYKLYKLAIVDTRQPQFPYNNIQLNWKETIPRYWNTYFILWKMKKNWYEEYETSHSICAIQKAVGLFVCPNGQSASIEAFELNVQISSIHRFIEGKIEKKMDAIAREMLKYATLWIIRSKIVKNGQCYLVVSFRMHARFCVSFFFYCC